MKNIDIALVDEGGAPLTPTELLALRKAIAVIEKHRDHVITRVKLRTLWGLVRASYAVRVRHCIPFLRWLLEDLSPLPVAEESEDVGTGAPQGGV